MKTPRTLLAALLLAAWTVPALSGFAQDSDGAAAAPASVVTVSWTEDDETTSNEYDLSDNDSALEFVGAYADNVQHDPAFAEHIDAALATIRENIAPYATWWSIFPPLLAIVLALITKEVYSSLFLGILAGGLLYSGWKLEGTIVHVFSDGYISSIADSYNVGILVFLVLLGALVSMMNKTGASAAFGRWAATHIKSRVGAQLATIILGMLIFVDDYFNCLTVGSVMKPVSDAKRVSRAKLAYLIDATAAPICIIAPISSWAAAVAGFAKGAGAESGFSLFLSAIPWNFYAILTIIMMFFLAITGFDFGLMRKHEENALSGDLFTSGGIVGDDEFKNANPKGRVWDLVVPVVFLIASCVVGMIYSGGYFGEDKPGFIQAFSDSDASVGLVYGSAATIVFAVVYFLFRRVISFKDCMTSLPEGFKAMVPAILILCSAWTLKAMTDSLGAKVFISQIINGPAASLQDFLPAIIFLIAVVLAFSTGTSWGTFGILIPIVLAASLSPFSTIISVSACMAGAVCGDHCSPISDTTIMASAGAACNHVNHVNTQLPYALLVAAVSFVSYLVAPFVKTWYVALPVAIVLMLATLFAMRAFLAPKKADA
jgi:Na+/H+ antiporter NhaC